MTTDNNTMEKMIGDTDHHDNHDADADAATILMMDVSTDSFLDFLVQESDQYIVAEPMYPVPQLVPKDHDPSVPSHMILGPSLTASASELSHAPLQQILLQSSGSVGGGGTAGGDAAAADYMVSTSPIRTSLAEIVQKQQNNGITLLLCLVMRRPGCPFCREDALELSRFVKGDPSLHLIGIVRDTTDPVGLHEMKTQYFDGHAIYTDVGMATYRGLGNRTILGRQLFNLPEATRRIEQKNIQYNLAGWTYIISGGVLIFDTTTGALQYVYRETYSDQLRIPDVQAAVRAVQRRQQQQQQQQSTTASTTTINMSCLN